MIHQDDNYFKISGHGKRESAIKFDFTCPKCHKKTVIGYDGSRYGQVGGFICSCGAKFEVTDNDMYKSPVKIWSDGKGIDEIETY